MEGECLKELEAYIHDAIKRASTDLEKERVETWKTGVWDYMNAGYQAFYSDKQK